MKIKYYTWLLAVTLLLPITFMSAQNTGVKQVNDSTLTNSVVVFMDDWHLLASNADIAYFNKIADNGNYIGTDATELWNKDEFFQWSKKYFESGKAWSFTVIERNVYFSDDKRYAWFNELLNTQMGVCRASGVLKRKGDSWEIEHYHLSVAIPNEKMNEVIEVIEGE